MCFEWSRFLFFEGNLLIYFIACASCFPADCILYHYFLPLFSSALSKQEQYDVTAIMESLPSLEDVHQLSWDSSPFFQCNMVRIFIFQIKMHSTSMVLGDKLLKMHGKFFLHVKSFSYNLIVFVKKYVKVRKKYCKSNSYK